MNDTSFEVVETPSILDELNTSPPYVTRMEEKQQGLNWSFRPLTAMDLF